MGRRIVRRNCSAVLEAYSSYYPPAADEEYLRKLARDTTTPGDELACQIIETERRKLRTKNKGSVSAAKAIWNKCQGNVA